MVWRFQIAKRDQKEIERLPAKGGDRSLTVAAPYGAARVSKRF